MSVATPQLTQIVGLTRTIASEFNPGCVVPFDLFDLMETQDGFGLSTGTGAALVWADVTDAAPSTWSLQFSASLAFDIPHRPEVGMWVNEQNRLSNLGRYYYVTTPDRSLSGVLWEMHVWSRLLEDISGMQGQGMIHWVAEILRDCLVKSSDEATAFAARFGGRVLEPTEKDLTQVFVASSG